MNKKSTPIIALGVAVFVIGGALLFLLLRGHDKKTTKTAPAASPTVTAAPAASAAAATPGAVTIKVPAGQNAVSVQMDYFNGVGGFAHAGDVVNVYAVVNSNCKDPKGAPLGVKLEIPNVKVLQVVESPAAQAGQPANYLLAVSPQDAERLIFLKTGYSLYFALAGANEPAPATSGISCTNGL